MSETVVKPGYKTLGFYLASLVTLASAAVGSGAGLGQTEGIIATVISILTAGGYAAYRVFVKSADPKKPAWKTTEFWLNLAAAALTIANFSGAFAETSTTGRVVAAVSGFLAMLGYQVTKPKL